jgi:cysteinyl-tRNA synthetase
MHGEFLSVRGTKMSKRFGNYTTARDLQQDGVDAGAIRLLIFQTHYRQKLELTDEALAAAREGARRLGEFSRRLEASSAAEESVEFARAAETLGRDFAAALNEDLNAPRAVAALFEFVSVGNRLLDEGAPAGPSALAAWRAADAVLDATTRPRVEAVGRTDSRSGGAQPLAEQPPENSEAQQEWARAWAGRRLEAKSRRDFTEADRIRALLQSRGWEVRDRKDGTIEVFRRS